MFCAWLRIGTSREKRLIGVKKLKACNDLVKCPSLFISWGIHSLNKGIKDLVECIWLENSGSAKSEALEYGEQLLIGEGIPKDVKLV